MDSALRAGGLPRVLFVQRPDALTRYGGDTKLALDTFEAVKALGVQTDMVESDRPDASGYDLAHVFNVGQPDVCRRQMDACEEAGVPVALSPVWLDLREYFGRAQAYEHLFLNAKGASAVEVKLAELRRRDPDSYMNRRQIAELQQREEQQAALLRRARVLLPNSAIEARDCLVRLGVHERPIVSVLIPADMAPEAYWQEDKRRSVLAIGRVETRKNQTGLLYALRDESFPVDVVGAIYHPELAKVCTRWCPRATLHGRLPREMMLEMLGRAEVHALVSWCETAGIATLEAAAAGAKIVVADRGAEVEYFGEDAEYADPADPDSIKAAVERAFRRPPRRRGDSLDQRMRRRTWRDAALETLRAYDIALETAAPVSA